MKHIPAGENNPFPIVELTRRNLEVLLAKLDDPASERSIIDGGQNVMVRAVENNVHYADRAPGDMFMPTEGTII